MHTSRVVALEQSLDWNRRRVKWIRDLSTHARKPAVVPRAQLGQDLFVLSVTDFMHGGYFVDIGAANGVDLSNTYLLEQSFGWNGIVAEAGRSWHVGLKRERRCAVDIRCVWRETGKYLPFTETDDGVFGTITDFVAGDEHAEFRRSGVEYEVETVSLNDLLAQHGAPRHIDYLSIDTEGSEYEIIRAFDFEAHTIGVLTIEHNFDEHRRELVKALLTANGFRQVMGHASKFEDWYVSHALSATHTAAAS